MNKPNGVRGSFVLTHIGPACLAGSCPSRGWLRLIQLIHLTKSIQPIDEIELLPLVQSVQPMQRFQIIQSIQAIQTIQSIECGPGRRRRPPSTSLSLTPSLPLPSFYPTPTLPLYYSYLTALLAPTLLSKFETAKPDLFETLLLGQSTPPLSILATPKQNDPTI